MAITGGFQAQESIADEISENFKNGISTSIT